MKYVTPAVALLILLVAAAPVAAQNKEHLQMEAELRMLQEQNQQLSLAFQQMAEAVKALNGRFDATMEALRKGFADQALATKNMAGDVSTIAERARDTDTKLRTLGDEITALSATITSLANAIAQGGVNTTTSAAPADGGAAPVAAGPAPVTPAVATPGPAAPAPPPNTLGLSPGRMLQQAKGDYDAGQFTLAITGFEQLIRTFPNTEAAVEAQYWIGESQLYLNKPADAVTAFNLALQKSNNFQYAPDALYKRGVAQRRLGDAAAARASYEQVIRQFPQSQSATLAQQELAKLPAAAGSGPARP